MHAFHLKETQWIKQIDYIVPVPLHVKRQKKRGYNQAECIAKGLASVLNIPIDNNNLYRTIYTETQTKKDKNSRIDNVKDVFALREESLFTGKHILLVDDVVTTGATVFGCEKALRNAKNIKLYLCCVAIPK
jgi:ComF family protein